MRLSVPVLLALAVLVSSGCKRGLNAEPVAASVQRPSNVATYVRVSDELGPKTDLERGDFAIYEDGQLLDADQAALVLLERELAAAFATVLLVDSSRAAGSPATEPLAGVRDFVSTVRKTQPVFVYGFSGADRIEKLAEIEQDAAGSPAAIELGKAPMPDASRDLHGAIVQGLAALDAALGRLEKPVPVGTLVIYTEGADLAGRTSMNQVELELGRTRHDVYLVSDREPDSEVQRIGRSGAFFSETTDELPAAFARAAARVNSVYASHYLLAYCSPARAGHRQLRVEVRTGGNENRSHSASFYTRFDASGFTTGCDSKAPPAFASSVLLDESGPILTALPTPTLEPQPEPPPVRRAAPRRAPAPKKPAAPPLDPPTPPQTEPQEPPKPPPPAASPSGGEFEP